MSEAQVGRNSIDTAYGLTGNFLDQEYSRDMYNTLKVNFRCILQGIIMNHHIK